LRAVGGEGQISSWDAGSQHLPLPPLQRIWARSELVFVLGGRISPQGSVSGTPRPGMFNGVRIGRPSSQGCRFLPGQHFKPLGSPGGAQDSSPTVNPQQCSRTQGWVGHEMVWPTPGAQGNTHREIRGCSPQVDFCFGDRSPQIKGKPPTFRSLILWILATRIGRAGEVCLWRDAEGCYEVEVGEDRSDAWRRGVLVVYRGVCLGLHRRGAA